MGAQRGKIRPPGRSSGIGLGVFIILAATLLQLFGALDDLERKTLDFRFIARGEKTPHPDILLVTIDEATRKALGKTTASITRKEYAAALDALIKSGAKIVAFDLDLATSRDGDEVLAHSIACSGKTILSSFIAMGDWVHPNPLFLDAQTACPTEPIESANKVLVGRKGVATVTWKPKPDPNLKGYRIYYSVAPFDDPAGIPAESGGFIDVKPEDTFLDLNVDGVPAGTALYTAVRGVKFGSFLGEGAVNIVEDSDARVREIPMLIARSQIDTTKKAALSLEIAVRSIFKGEPEISISTLYRLKFRENDIRLDIPLVEGQMSINYRGGRDTYPRISFGDIIQSKFDPKKIENKIILIGNTHQLAHDEYPTPFGMHKISDLDAAEKGLAAGYTSGLEIHANALDTLLTNDFIIPFSLYFDRWIEKIFSVESGDAAIKFRLKIWDASIIIFIGLISIALLIVWRAPLSLGAAMFFGILIIQCAIGYFGFVKGIWVPMAGQLFVVASIYAGSLLSRARLREREKAWIKDTFGKYLAPAVVDQITKNPSLVELGGTEMELTAFFSDIQKFSTISEQLGSASTLVELLNEYLTAMAGVIENYEGTIDKYEGDAIMAFWGAPVHFPNHAVRACNACLDMQEFIKRLREKWRADNRWPELVNDMRVRMGVNTGPMVVGNMGSEGRMNYTVMGDAVNLASRLEGANKAYGTYIMISHDTYSQTSGEFEVRFLDVITVVGKQEPVKVYELMSRKGRLDEPAIRMLRAYDDGISQYNKRNWEAAISCFEAALGLVTDDGPSRTYVERCKLFIKEPPAADWDGVFRLKGK